MFVPWCLPGRISKGSYPSVGQSHPGAGTVEGSGFQIEANKGDQMRGWNATEENGEFVIGNRYEAHLLYRKQLMYYTISRAFIDIPGIIV
jgi:hypothetical protein